MTKPFLEYKSMLLAHKYMLKHLFNLSITNHGVCVYIYICLGYIFICLGSPTGCMHGGFRGLAPSLF